MRVKRHLLFLIVISILIETNFNYAGEWSYYVKDHLGNTRVVLDSTGGVKAIYDYYPFGLSLRSVVTDEDARYKFTGKELDKEGELDWYYFGARYYDPEIARWLSVDPLSTGFPSWSPYNYVFNNPLRLTDPTGMGPPWEAFDIGGGPMAWAEKLIWGWTSFSSSLKQTVDNIGSQSSLESQLERAELYSEAYDKSDVAAMQKIDNTATRDALLSTETASYVAFSVGKQSQEIGLLGGYGTLAANKTGLFLTAGYDRTLAISTLPGNNSLSLSFGLIIGPQSGFKGPSTGGSFGLGMVGVEYSRSANIHIPSNFYLFGNTHTISMTLSSSLAWASFYGGYTFQIY